MGCIRCVGCENLQRDFMARTFALIAPIQYVLHQVSCSYETIPNAPKYYKTHRNISLGSNGWIGCFHCEKSRCDFVAQTFALIAPVHPFCTEFHAVTKQSQMHPSTIKRTRTGVLGPMAWIRCVDFEKLQCDFGAQTFALIAPVLFVLQQVLCGYEMIPNAPKYYETHRNISLGSNGVDWARLLQKIPTWLRGTNFCINCTSSPNLAPSFI